MTTYYVMADLHGRYDLLQLALDKIDEVAKPPYQIITLGDYIDRGPQSRQVIEKLMNLHGSIVCLKGNHEAMMVESITSLPNINWWVSNGGDATIESYVPQVLNKDTWHIKLPQGVIPDEHVKWMANLPIYYETDKQLFVHAGVPQAEMKLPPKNAHHLQDMMWMLYGKDDGRGWRGKHVVHGHHQFEDGPHVWHSKSGGRTDLDCWAYHTGRLVIGVFDDTQGPAKEFIEVFADKPSIDDGKTYG